MREASRADDVAQLRPGTGRGVRLDEAARRLPTGPHARTLPSRPVIAALPGQRERLLRLLVNRAPAYDEIATLILRDPGLLHALLEAAPLDGRRLGSALRGEVTRRLETLGPDLLRAWLLTQTWDAPPAPPHALAAGLRAVLVAECALHLALETRYAHPDEAYLAGLWRALGSEACSHTDAADASDPQCRCVAAPSADEAALAAVLAARCGVPEPVADALAFRHELDEAYLAAHPLVRLVWAAERLAHEDWRREADRVGTACALPREAVLSLRTDVGYLAGEDDMPPPAADFAARPATALLASNNPADGAGAAMRELVLAGLMRGAFFGIDTEALGARLDIACRLLCGETPPLVVVADEHDALHPLPLSTPAKLLDWYAELGLRKDDEASAIALAVRSATVTSWFPGSPSAQRSPRDWHIARRLGRTGLTCLPLHLPGTSAVAILGADEAHPRPPATQALLTELVAAACAAVLELRRHQAASRDSAQRVEQRFREHARKIAHEASNPLTVVRSHLEMLARRDTSTAAASREEFALLQAELERIASLLRRAGTPAAEEAEPASCHLPQLLEELRTVYGESLFGRRDIRFELRTAAVPPVAMPASALTQVLLNLFRNAAEALQPGGRFAVTVPGVVLSNGAPCVELRLIDNGPGLPPERQADLLAPRASAKGDDHQGLGLAIVHEILARWKVACLCRSQAGTGTSYQLFVPLAKCR